MDEQEYINIYEDILDDIVIIKNTQNILSKIDNKNPYLRYKEKFEKIAKDARKNNKDERDCAEKMAKIPDNIIKQESNAGNHKELDYAADIQHR